METVKQTIRRVLAQANQAAVNQAEAGQAQVERANRSARCHQVKQNGVRCGSPAMQGQPFCYFHDRMLNRMPAAQFPPLEDGNAVQCAIMQVLEGIASGSIPVKEANSMLYALQMASANLSRVQFEPLHPITRMPMDNTAPAEGEAKPMAMVAEIKAMAARG